MIQANFLAYFSSFIIPKLSVVGHKSYLLTIHILFSIFKLEV